MEGGNPRPLESFACSEVFTFFYSLLALGAYGLRGSGYMLYARVADFTDISHIILLMQ